MGFALSELQLTSSAFGQGDDIPTTYTGEGDDVSPPMSWRDAPPGTRSFALICHDPDAPLVSGNGTYGFVHWVLYNIPGSVSSLDKASTDYTVGRNDFGNPGYVGPMPPEGHGEHYYYFWLLALDTDTPWEEGLTLWELLAKVEPHLKGMNRLVGRYRRD